MFSGTDNSIMINTSPRYSQSRLQQSFDHHSVIRDDMVTRSTSKVKTPLKALDVDLSATSYLLEANDRTVVKSNKLVKDYKFYDQYMEYRDCYQGSNMPDSRKQIEERSEGSIDAASLVRYGGQQVWLY